MKQALETLDSDAMGRVSRDSVYATHQRFIAPRVMSPAGLEKKNDCAGEDHQQFTR
jgi:hypothetical protein